MKKQIRHVIHSLRHTRSQQSRLLLLSALLWIGASVTGQAQVLVNEDFESGTLDGWQVGASPATMLTSSTEQNILPVAGTYSAKMVSSQDRIATNVVITAGSSKLTYYFYDSSATRAYAEARTYDGGAYNVGGLLQLLAAGKYVASDIAGDPYDPTKYQGRMLGAGFGWFNLNAPGSPVRSPGWHRFDIERGVNIDSTVTVRFFADGALSRSFTRSAVDLPAWNAITLGFGSGSTGGDAYFDGVRVVQGQPYIQVQPKGKTNAVGTDTTLSVTAIGNATLAYQWYKEGGLLTGKTDSSLLLSNPQIGDSGNYSVVITNDLDKSTSSVAVVSIVLPLAIITQPQNSPILNPGATAHFDVVASSANPISYSWRKGTTALVEGGIISGSATANLTLTGISAANAGTNYNVVVSDGINPSVTSTNVSLTLNAPPVGTGSNQTATVGSVFSYNVPATDDYSITSTPFQTFEAFNPGANVMLADPTASGTTGFLTDTNVAHFSYVTNVFPANHASSKVLQAKWSFADGGASEWARMTTATNLVTNMINPTISFSRSLRFDMYTDRDLQLALGVRETSPAGPIGTYGGGSGPIEWVGSTGAVGNGPAPTRTITNGVWTQVQFDLLTEPVTPFGGTGANGVLNSTTGFGVLEHLALVSPGGNTYGEFNIFLDNFLVLETNAITFSLVSGPTNATIDAATGLLCWTPAALGVSSFSVRLTDSGGLSSTNSFNVTAIVAAPPILTHSHTGNSITLNWTGTFDLQSKTNLSSGTWDNVGVSNGPYTTGMTNVATFYRLKSP
ncbi:MAG: multidomain protein with s-layer y region, glug motif, ig motif, i-set domain, pkd domain [Verrucomicrobiales bacterium]|nr:multidomain protein with s-layer y region, glug motif, ig motif, i-set domain, pkd domain [Verrucomicrobiales bacterium]